MDQDRRDASDEPSTEIVGDETPETSWPKVIGIISLIYAIAGVLCQGASGLSTLVSEWLMSLGGMDVTMPPIFKIVGLSGMAVLWVVGVLMIVGSIRLLRRRASGVALLKTWVVVRLLVLVVSTVVGFFLLPANIAFQRDIREAQNQQLRDSGRSDLVQEFDEDAVWLQAKIMTGVMTALTAAYPLFLGFYLSRRKIADEVATWDGGGGGWDWEAGGLDTSE